MKMFQQSSYHPSKHKHTHMGYLAFQEMSRHSQQTIIIIIIIRIKETVVSLFMKLILMLMLSSMKRFTTMPQSLVTYNSTQYNAIQFMHLSHNYFFLFCTYTRVLHVKDATSAARREDVGPSSARSASSSWDDPLPAPRLAKSEFIPFAAAEAT